MFKKGREEGIVIANIMQPFTIMGKETDMPMKSSQYLVWTLYDQKIRSYHINDIDLEIIGANYAGQI